MITLRPFVALTLSALPLSIAFGCGVSQLDVPRATGAGGAATTASSSATQSNTNAATVGPQTAVSTANVGTVGVGGSGGFGGSGGANVVASSVVGTGGTGGFGGETSVVTTVGPGGEGGGPSCAPLGDPCTKCASQACPATYCNCVNDGECIALIECSNGCNGDKTCQQACFTAHQEGISEATLLSDCGATDCPGECGNSAPLKPCTKCLLQNCEADANACLADSECLALYTCLSGCPSLDLMCQKQCYAEHGGGIPTLQPLLMCSQQVCAPTCT